MNNMGDIQSRLAVVVRDAIDNHRNKGLFDLPYTLAGVRDLYDRRYKVHVLAGTSISALVQFYGAKFWVDCDRNGEHVTVTRY